MSDGSRWQLDWPVCGGARVGRALLKSSPDDFRVAEVLWPEFEDDSGSRIP